MNCAVKITTMENTSASAHMDIEENDELSIVKEEPVLITFEKISLTNFKGKTSSNLLITDASLREAFVYTTKLDHMRTLRKDLKKYKTKEIIAMLLKESKPKWDPVHIKNLHNMRNDRFNHLINLNEVIAHIKTKTALEHQLDEIPEPLSNNLTDMNTSFQLTQNDEQDCVSIYSVSESLTSNDDEDEDDEILLQDLKMGSTIQDSALIVLINVNTEIGDIYHLNSMKDVIYYKKDVLINLMELNVTYPGKPKTIRKYCCWLNRHETINFTCLKRFPSATVKFLRKDHDCVLGDCQCCCRGKPKYSFCNKKPPEKIDNWIQDLVSNNTPISHNCVVRAMNYIPKQKETLHLSKKQHTVNIAIIIHNRGIMAEQLNLIDEFYEIGSVGELVRYMKPVSVPDLQIIQEQYASQAVSVKHILKEICCWYEREKLISELKQVNISPTAIKYVQIPHMCDKLFLECRCCCKTRKSLFKDIDMVRTIKPLIAGSKRKENIFSISFDRHELFGEYISTNSELKNYHAENITSQNILRNMKNIKLIIQNGQLAVILGVPAKNLTISELHVLSKVITEGEKQITEVGITGAEYCQKINSTSIQLPPVPGESVNNKLPETRTKARIGSRFLKSNLLNSFTNLMASQNIQNIECYYKFISDTGKHSIQAYSVPLPKLNICPSLKKVQPQIENVFSLAPFGPTSPKTSEKLTPSTSSPRYITTKEASSQSDTLKQADALSNSTCSVANSKRNISKKRSIQGNTSKQAPKTSSLLKSKKEALNQESSKTKPKNIKSAKAKRAKCPTNEPAVLKRIRVKSPNHLQGNFGNTLITPINIEQYSVAVPVTMINNSQVQPQMLKRNPEIQVISNKTLIVPQVNAGSMNTLNANTTYQTYIMNNNNSNFSNQPPVINSNQPENANLHNMTLSQLIRQSSNTQRLGYFRLPNVLNPLPPPLAPIKYPFDTVPQNDSSTNDESNDCAASNQNTNNLEKSISHRVELQKSTIQEQPQHVHNLPQNDKNEETDIEDSLPLSVIYPNTAGNKVHRPTVTRGPPPLAEILPDLKADEDESDDDIEIIGL